MVLTCETHRKELSAGFRRTTNNRMEIMAAIAGLRALKAPSDVRLYTDSQYLANAINQGWAKRWRVNGWRRGKGGDRAANPDLWEQLLDLCAAHRVEFIWVRGHAGHPENERCDQLAVAAAHAPALPRDEEYERGQGLR